MTYLQNPNLTGSAPAHHLMDIVNNEGFLIIDCISQDVITLVQKSILSQIQRYSNADFSTWQQLVDNYLIDPKIHHSLKHKNHRIFSKEVVDTLLA